MEHSIVEEKIKQKEIEIIEKIDQLENNEEIWCLLKKGSCFRFVCWVERNHDLAKADLYDIMAYIINIDEIVLENLKKKTLMELWELLALYLDKRDVLRQSIKS